MNKNGGFPITWGHAFGSKNEFHRGGPLAPEFDGHFFGFQAGMGIGAAETWEGDRDHFGLFVGQRRLASGTMPMHAKSLGIYWTHVGSGSWYLERVLLHSRLDGEPRSNRGGGIDLEGHGTTALLKGGYPIWLTEKISLEPQVQIIWQHVSFARAQDRFSSVSFDADDAWTGRIGAKSFERSKGLMPIGVVKDSIQAFTDGHETLLCSSAFDKCVPELGQRFIESRVAHHTVGGMADLRADGRVLEVGVSYHPNASLTCGAEFDHNASRHEQVLKVTLRRRGISRDSPGAHPLSKGKAEVHKQGRGRHARISSLQTAHERTFLSDIEKPRGEGTLLCEGQTSCLPRWMVP